MAKGREHVGEYRGGIHFRGLLRAGGVLPPAEPRVGILAVLRLVVLALLLPLYEALDGTNTRGLT